MQSTHNTKSWLLCPAFFFLFLAHSCESVSSLFTKRASANVKVVQFAQVEKYLQEKASDQLLVVNFWATWCEPCVEEIPQIREAYETYKEKGMEMVLVSVDPVEKLEKFKKFIQRADLQMTHYLLDEVDFRSAIKGMEPRWSGEIPATFFLKRGEKLDFHVGFFPRNDLLATIEEHLE